MKNETEQKGASSGAQMSQHTPIPWFVSQDGAFKTMIRSGSPQDGRRVASTFIGNSPGTPEGLDRQIHENESNAEFIVRAVNCHDELLAALKSMTLKMEEVAAHEGASRDELIERMHLGYTPHFRVARAAIAKAEKGGVR